MGLDSWAYLGGLEHTKRNHGRSTPISVVNVFFEHEFTC